MTVPVFVACKAKKQPIVMVTAYEAAQARLADAAGVDAILVGDSLGMVMLGYTTTLPVTLDDMLRHTQAVARGSSGRPLLIADMPFATYGVSEPESIRNAARLLAEGGAQAIKLEGGAVIADTVRRIVDRGIPVMGHIGMTPQSVHRFGGFKVQGKGEAADAVLADAEALVAAGVFSIVLEVIPTDLARRISEAIPVPTIGIGAGVGCDGQVQVFHDLVGLYEEPPLRHTRRYAEAGRAIREALAAYAEDVRSGRFPSDENAF